MRASAAAASPPPSGGGGQQHPPQRTVNLSPLGMLDSAVAVPAVSPETRDDAGVAAATAESSGAPVRAPQERRETSGGKEEEEGGQKEGRRRPKRSKSVRRFFGRTSSNVLSYLTIMTTWVLFRFLLKGLNKVFRCLIVVAALAGGDVGGFSILNATRWGRPRRRA